MKTHKNYVMILASSGEMTQKDVLDKHLKKPLKESSIVHITSASKNMGTVKQIEKQKSHYIQNAKEYLEIDIMDYSQKELNSVLAKVDIVHVDGGDPFRLLKAARKSGLKKVLTKLMPSGLAYIGTNAGTLLACPSIQSCLRDESKPQKEKYGIKNMSAMGLVPFLIAVDMTSENLDDLEWGAMSSSKMSWLLSDKEAIWVHDGKTDLLGGDFPSIL